MLFQNREICIITEMAAELIGEYNPEYPTRNRDTFWQKIVATATKFYLRAYHGYEVEIDPSIPKTGPALVLTAHFSILDTLAALAGDPYRPRTRMVVKQGMMGAPIFGEALRAWRAIPVDRDGRDMAAVKAILSEFENGGIICIAAEGTRNRQGRLGETQRSVVGIALMAAGKNIPLLPAAEIGTYEALPPGAKLPKFRSPIKFKTGPLIDLSPWAQKPRKELTEADLAAAGTEIQRNISALLPLERRPLGHN